MKLNELRPAEGSARKPFRKGRGPGSGGGKTACRGQKGQNSRSGGGVRPGFEGGQLPLYRRHPKRGFHNRFTVSYATVNVGDLDRFFSDGDEVSMATLLERRVVRQAFDGLKILGDGRLTKRLTVEAEAFSASAKAKIEAAGGQAKEV